MTPIELLWAHIDGCERCGDISRLCPRGEELRESALGQVAEMLAPMPTDSKERN